VGEIPQARLEQSVAELSPDVEARTEWLSRAFRDVGCPARVISGAQGDNVLCTLPGASSWIVVVGANVDRPSAGQGVVDNWTGMVLLPLLYESLRVEPRRHSFVFAGFTDALLKQRGARRYLKELGPDGRASIRAMVQLKALGIGTPAMWAAHADPNLRQDLFSVSRALELPLRVVNFQENVAVDAKAFRQTGIPTITIHSLDQSSARLLAQPYRDRDAEAIDWENYHATARLLATYLAYLDMTLQVREDRPTGESAPREEPPQPL